VSPESPTPVLLRARISYKSFAGLYIVLVALCAVIWWTGWTYETGLHPALILGAGLLPPVLGIVYSWLVRLGAEYRLHQESLEVERGIVARSIDNLQLFRVRDLRLRQSILGRVFGVGDIVVTSTDQSTPELTIRGVAEPRALYDTLREGVARSQATRRTMIVEDDRPS
jgi:uncharacterized membrane protein YdbT with pleckstrin-like domain